MGPFLIFAPGPIRSIRVEPAGGDGTSISSSGLFPREGGCLIRLSIRSRLLVSVILPAATLFGLPASTAGVAAAVKTPLQRAASGSSLNWAGYASKSGPFSSVSASWIQPAGICLSSKTTYAAFWVGLDGDGSNSVEQNGSEVDCVGGVPTYYAWYEMYPSPTVTYTNTVNAGDLFNGSVTATADGAFTLTLTDVTEGWTQVQKANSPSAERFSAEILVEAPSDGSGALPLTDFGQVTFSRAKANGAFFGTLNPKKIIMESGTTIKARPGHLVDNRYFEVTWEHA